MSDKGGCHAFFATIRHRKPCKVGITDEDIARIVKYSPVKCKYWLLVCEKEGEDKHAHWVMFPHIAQQRSNMVKQIAQHVLFDWTDAEVNNFKKWDRKTGTGACKTVTSLDLISGYLDGTYEKKCQDKFEIVDECLPQDLHELEKWIPDVGALKRRPNVRFHTLLKQCMEHFGLPDRGEKKISLNLIQTMFYRLENEDIRECIVDPRIAKNFITRFHRWYNKYEHDDSYHPACRGEAVDIGELLAEELAEDSSPA